MFQGSLLVIVMMINGSENAIVKAAFKLQSPRVFEKRSDLHQQSTYYNGLPSKTINVTTQII